MVQGELKSLDPAMLRALPIITRVFQRYAPAGFVVEFTAGKEWFGHGLFSLHHQATQ